MFDFGKHLGVAAQWAGVLLKSGILFWIGGITVWFWHHRLWQWGSAKLWESFIESTNELNSLQISLITLACFLIIASLAGLVQLTELQVLRLLEGYYVPSWLKKPWMKWQNSRIERIKQRLQELYRKQDKNTLSSIETEQLLRLEKQLEAIPEPEAQRMPTRLGNLLRQMELHAHYRYGLNTFICWPHLWLVMPEHAKAEVSQARERLNNAAQMWMWGALFIIFSFWAWWAAIVSLLTLLLAYRALLNAASVYRKLVQASFDLYRPLLYQALRLPDDPTIESKQGEKITRYLAQGLASDAFKN